jgi:hypothetical protein
MVASREQLAAAVQQASLLGLDRRATNAAGK